jgi:predicted component of type VI protein secretion system
MINKNEKFYSIPFLSGQTDKTKYVKVDVETSVRQNLRLMVSTIPSQFRYDPTFGAELNLEHFRLPDLKQKGSKRLEDDIKDTLKKNLLYLISKHEPRLEIEDLLVNIFSQKEGNKTLLNKPKGGKIIFEIKLLGRILGQEKFIYNDLIPLL